MSAPFRFPKLLRYRSWTLQRFYDHVNMPARLQAVLAGQSGDYLLPRAQVSFLLHVSLIDNYGRGAYYPRKHFFHRATVGNGFGALVPKLPTNMSSLPAARQNIAYMTLPEGFEYSVVSYRDQVMRDGKLVPGAADGMASFGIGRGRIALVRNHELSTSGTAVVAPDATYDPQVRGGTTNLVVDNEGVLIEQYGSLAGTERKARGAALRADLAS